MRSIWNENSKGKDKEMYELQDKSVCFSRHILSCVRCELRQLLGHHISECLFVFL